MAEGSGDAETPMEIVVNVIDQNDNNPNFEKDTYMGEVAEASPTSTVCDSALCTNIYASVRWHIMTVRAHNQPFHRLPFNIYLYICTYVLHA